MINLALGIMIAFMISMSIYTTMAEIFGRVLVFTIVLSITEYLTKDNTDDTIL